MSKIFNKRISYLHILVFSVLLILFFSYLILTQNILPKEGSYDFNSVETFNSEWTLIKDNKTQIVNLPGYFDIKYGDTFIIEKELPEELNEYNTLLIWNTGKDFNVYLDNEIIFTYNENNIHKIGLDRPYIYVWVILPEGSDGKNIRIEYTSIIKKDADYVGWVYLGERASIISTLVSPYKGEVAIAMMVFILSIACIVGGFIINKNLLREEPLIYMGVASGLASLWILSNSKLRQFIFLNTSSIRNIAFLVVPLLAITFLFYLDLSQNKRFHKVYVALQSFGFIEIIVVFILHIKNIFGLSETFNLSLIYCGIMILVCFATLVSDIIHKRIKQYLWSTIGILIFGVFTFIQIISYRFIDSIYSSGIYMLTGLLFFVIFALINAFTGITRVRKEKNEALKRVKTVSNEAIETIAMTVDAKDKYTSKHSVRVAAYSLELAKVYGFNEKELERLRFGALLHDIGKIGIPDAVLNKPSKLTEEEYKTIQTHTTIGGDIMMQMTSVSGVDNIARHHHERYDGTGYPDGFVGEEIPIEARIVCIADAYDAMNSRRVYRKNLTKEIIRDELVKGRGTQFDPGLLDLFLELFDSGRLDEIEKGIEE